MKKIVLSLILSVASNITYSGRVGVSTDTNWNGFYLGGNAGYWSSQANKIVTTGSVNYINPIFPLGAGNIANALVLVATNNFSLDSTGFLAGGQAGYNYQQSKKILLGLNVGFDGLVDSDRTYALQKVVNLTNFDEYYVGSLAVQQKIHYLGTVSARLGYLYHPNFLIYGTGGLAYGKIGLDTAWSVNESLGPTVFPPIAMQNNLSQTLPGWTAGAGVEWLFKPWSVKIDYTYYRLNTLNVPAVLAQRNAAETPAILWGSTDANTALTASIGSVRVGINYHFA
ncbi:Opacity protein and related surface antigens [Legionella wadsworthii]|uniref:Opacity protein and related surface antigens n=1 Tax=Legionella wadsworthii TaxID=28088 RepID=A0A378LWF6_9GAMM|nr:outer membrane beta-barrel protein [Legionella wadsworthii]STY31444.1 Opacity protein and related surface antigens [Legionella wadsworthii]